MLRRGGGGPQPTNRPTHLHQKNSPQEKMEYLKRGGGVRLEAGSRYTNCFWPLTHPHTPSPGVLATKQWHDVHLLGTLCNRHRAHRIPICHHTAALIPKASATVAVPSFALAGLGLHRLDGDGLAIVLPREAGKGLPAGVLGIEHHKTKTPAGLRVTIPYDLVERGEVMEGKEVQWHNWEGNHHALWPPKRYFIVAAQAQTCRPMGLSIQAYKHTSIQAYKHTSIQAYKHTSIQAYKHTSIQAYLHAQRSAGSPAPPPIWVAPPPPLARGINCRRKPGGALCRCASGSGWPPQTLHTTNCCDNFGAL